MSPDSGVEPRRVVVAAERLEGFLARVAERHGELSWAISDDMVVVSAADATVVECRVPFPPLAVDPAASYGGLLAHVLQDRTIGVVLVRRGGYAAGVFVGTELVASKVGSRHVQGRTAAGGQSQQRFARRREGQARVAMEAATDVVAATVLPHLARLDAVVAGGDRTSCDQVFRDRRLQPLRDLLVAERLDVPDPRQRVLESAPALYRSVRVTVIDS